MISIDEFSGFQGRRYLLACVFLTVTNIFEEDHTVPSGESKLCAKGIIVLRRVNMVRPVSFEKRPGFRRTRITFNPQARSLVICSASRMADELHAAKMSRPPYY